MDDFVNPDKSGGAGSADAGNGIEVRALLLREGDDGKWFWAVVVEGCGGCDGPDIVSRHANAADAKDAAYLTAQRLGGTMVYLRSKVRRP